MNNQHWKSLLISSNTHSQGRQIREVLKASNDGDEISAMYITTG